LSADVKIPDEVEKKAEESTDIKEDAHIKSEEKVEEEKPSEIPVEEVQEESPLGENSTAEENAQSPEILTASEKMVEKTEIIEGEEKLPVEEKAGLVEVIKTFIKEDDQIKFSENSKNEEPVEYVSNDSDIGSMESDDDSISDTDILIPTPDEKQKVEEKEIEAKES